MKPALFRIAMTCVILTSLLIGNLSVYAGEAIYTSASTTVSEHKDSDKADFGTENRKAAVQPAMPGDVNGDGKVKLDDAILLRRYVAGWEVDIDLLAADVNGDRKVKLNDAIILRRYVAGWDLKLTGPSPDNPQGDLNDELPEDLRSFEELTVDENEEGIQKASFRYGTSVQGRDLIGWSITQKTWSRTILLNFEIHGWEDGYAADGQLLVSLGEAVVSHYADVSDMYGCRLIIIPSCNPDGLAEGMTNDGFGRCNADGIDLNRDFDVDYQAYDNARNYTPYAFSGKESAALRDLVFAVNPQVAIDFHGWENCTIGSSDVAEVFSLYCGLNHKNEFSSSAHGYFAYWVQEQGAEGLLVEFKDVSNVNHAEVIRALDRLIQDDYGMHSTEETDESFAHFCPIKAYAMNSGRLYTQREIGDTGTSYGYIDGESDQCDIIQIYKNGWCKVRYPASSNIKTGYCLLSGFIEERLKVSPYQAAVAANTTVYTSSDMATVFGSVWSTDILYVVAETDVLAQIIYPLDAGGYKMGWIDKEQLNRQEYTAVSFLQGICGGRK